jgi:hypothetical protein
MFTEVILFIVFAGHASATAALPLLAWQSFLSSAVRRNAGAVLASPDG